MGRNLSARKPMVQKELRQLQLKCPVSDFSFLPSSEVPSVNLNSSLVICPLPEALTGGKYQLLPQLQPSSSMNFRTLEECSIMSNNRITGCPSTIERSNASLDGTTSLRLMIRFKVEQSCQTINTCSIVIILPTFAPEIHFQSKIHVIHSLFILHYFTCSQIGMFSQPIFLVDVCRGATSWQVLSSI